MKKILIVLFLSVFCFSDPAYAGSKDLVGTWEYTMVCMRIGDNLDHNLPAVISRETTQFVITDYSKNVLKGYSCDAEAPNGYLFGATDGRKVYITTWDSFTIGTLNSSGNKIRFVSQNILDNPPTAPGACKGKAKKVAATFDCEPAAPIL